MTEAMSLLMPLLRCPQCFQPALDEDRAQLTCSGCGAVYPIRNGVVSLLAPGDRALADRAFGRFAARMYDSTSARGGFRRWVAGDIGAEVRRFTQPLHLDVRDVVVDVGCGTGNYTLEFARQVQDGLAIGIDLSAAMLDLFVQHARAEQIANAVAIQANAENLPFRDGSLGKMFNGCLHHLAPQLLPALREAYRSLCGAGVFYSIMNVQAKSGLMRLLQRISMGSTARPVDTAALHEAVQQAGFTAIRIEDAGLERFYFGTCYAEKPAA